MKKTGVILLCLLMSLLLVSCELIAYEPGDAEPEKLTVELVYGLAAENGYEGTLEDFINEFKGDTGPAGADGKDGVDGQNGFGIKSVTVNSTGHLIIEYDNSSTYDAGLVIFTPDYDRITPSIGDNGNWYIGGNDTGVPSDGEAGAAWHTGTSLPDDELGFDGDFYISTSTLNVYYRDGGAWGLVGSVSGSLGGGSLEMSQAAISRAMLSSVSVFCALPTGYQTGSGVIYQLDKSTGDAYIITNYHVVYNEDTGKVFNNSELSVFLYGMEYDDFEIPAAYVGGSEAYDIAVLKVSGNELIKTRNVRSAVIADSDNVSVLDTVVAVGNPLGGGISATRGAINVASEYADTETSSEIRVMRIDVPVNQGNSGGGLFNTNGELVGIVNAKAISTGVENIGYAIPSNTVARLVENILYYCDGTSEIYGKTVTLGIELDVDDVYVGYDEVTEKLINNQTVKVINVKSASLAESSGLQAGDIIKSITIGGIEYPVTQIYQPIEARLLMRPSETVVYKIERSGTEMTVTINLPDKYSFVKIY